MKNKIALILVMAMVMGQASTFAMTFSEINISDVTEPASTWAQSSIDQAIGADLVTPRTNGFFTKEITRVQFAELVVNLVEKELGKVLEPAPMTTFTDTTDDFVLKAYSAGIANGKTKTTFAPDALITREEIAAMLFRATSNIEKNSRVVLKTGGDLHAYVDQDKLSSWAVDGVRVLANNGIMKGTSAVNLSPSANATIEQCIIFINRFHNIYKQ